MTPLSPMQKRFLHNGWVRQVIISPDGQYQTPDALLVLDMKVCDECGEVNHINNYYCYDCGGRIVIRNETRKIDFDMIDSDWEARANKRAEEIRKKNGTKITTQGVRKPKKSKK